VIRILLVRHGVTAWNQDSRYQGHQDVPLGDLGRQQAQRLAVRLRSERIDAAYSSDLVRASETASIVLEGRDIDINTTPQLREMSFGAWEGLRHDEIGHQYPAEWGAWTKDTVATSPPGGESLQQLRERLMAFYGATIKLQPAKDAARDWFAYQASGLGSAAERPQTLLMVTHGGPVRLLLTALLDMPADHYWRFAIRPASLSILDVYPEGAIAEVIGDTSHLDAR
jgi:alpha-ribazole phosphatase